MLLFGVCEAVGKLRGIFDDSGILRAHNTLNHGDRAALGLNTPGFGGADPDPRPLARNIGREDCATRQIRNPILKNALLRSGWSTG